RRRILGYAGVLSLPLEREETKHLILDDGAANGTAKELSAVWTLRARLLLEDVLRVELLFPEESKRRAVIRIAARLGDQVDRRAFRAPVRGGETLGADYKFLNGLEGQLHHWTADGIVLVIDTVDGHVDIATALPIYGENCIAVFGGIIRIGRLYSGRQIRQVRDVASEQREFFHFARRNVLAHARLQLIEQRSFAGDFNRFARSAGTQLGVYCRCLTDQKFDGLRYGDEPGFGN